jgi:transposase
LLIVETRPVTERVRVREIDDDEGRRLVRIIRRGTGSVVTWRRAQMVLLSAQGMDVAAIAKVAFTSEDRVRDVLRNFNADGFSSLYPRYKGGRPPKFTLGQRREIKKIAKSRPVDHDLPFPPGACRSWRSSWWLRGWSTTSATKACAFCSARRASPFSA